MAKESKILRFQRQLSSTLLQCVNFVISCVKRRINNKVIKNAKCSKNIGRKIRDEVRKSEQGKRGRERAENSDVKLYREERFNFQLPSSSNPTCQVNEVTTAKLISLIRINGKASKKGGIETSLPLPSRRSLVGGRTHHCAASPCHQTEHQ